MAIYCRVNLRYRPIYTIPDASAPDLATQSYRGSSNLDNVDKVFYSSPDAIFGPAERYEAVLYVLLLGSLSSCVFHYVAVFALSARALIGRDKRGRNLATACV